MSVGSRVVLNLPIRRSVKLPLTSALERQLLDNFQLSPSALGHFHVCLQSKPFCSVFKDWEQCP